MALTIAEKDALVEKVKTAEKSLADVKETLKREFEDTEENPSEEDTPEETSEEKPE